MEVQIINNNQSNDDFMYFFLLELYNQRKQIYMSKRHSDYKVT